VTVYSAMLLSVYLLRAWKCNLCSNLDHGVSDVVIIQVDGSDTLLASDFQVFLGHHIQILSGSHTWAASLTRLAKALNSAT